MVKETDVVVVGTGAAGLFCALHFPEDTNVLVITKDEADKSDSFLAQGHDTFIAKDCKGTYRLWC